MIWNSVWVAAGGFFGAMARYGMSRWIGKRNSTLFPLGTLVINLLGSFLLGMIIGSEWGDPFSLLFGTGFLGAFTTFSTFKLESVQLGMNKEWRMFAVYLGISYTMGIILGFLGFAIGSAIHRFGSIG